jgi:MFS family permease
LVIDQLSAPRSATTGAPAPSGRAGLPMVIYLLTAGTFLMGTTELLVAGLLPEMAADFDTTVARAGLAITVFAIGMIVGAPSMALLTLRWCLPPGTSWSPSGTPPGPKVRPVEP